MPICFNTGFQNAVWCNLNFTSFDIETGPLLPDQLRSIVPAFDRSSIRHPGAFDPKSVKLGGLKKKELIDEKLDKARAAHEEAVEKYEETLESAERNYWYEIEDKAALSSTTGRILAIGFGDDFENDLMMVSESQSEFAIIKKFWQVFEQSRKKDVVLTGFNINDFDIPFICQRSIIVGIPVPKSLFSGRYLSSTFIDLRKVWQFGSFEKRGSLDTICRALGIGGKTEGVTGAMFAKLWLSDSKEDQDKAVEYFERDVRMTYEFASRVL